jgi:hypothetical protein
MQGVTESGSGLRVGRLMGRCPYAPGSVVTAHSKTLAARTAEALLNPVSSHPAGVVQTESKRRISLDRSRQKRGPPALLSL